MKKIKFLAFAVMMVLSVASVTYFNSCKKDPCKDVVCNNGGTCVDGTCSCTTGYEGTNCETKSRDKFIGVFKGAETCTVGTDNYSVTLTAGSSSDLTIVYSNMYNQGFTATANVGGTTSFTIASQTVGTGSGGNVTASGTATISSDGKTLTVNYTIASGSTTNSCTFTGTKQ
jgi:hypothetical protein